MESLIGNELECMFHSLKHRESLNYKARSESIVKGKESIFSNKQDSIFSNRPTMMKSVADEI